MPSVDNSWSSTSLVPTQQQRYLWKFEYIYYSDGSVEVTDPVNLSIAGADADTTGITETLDKTKQELTNVANDLSKAKTDLKNAVSEVDTKATNLKSDLTQAKQDLASQAQQLQAQASAQSELTKRVSTVEKTADGTKTTVSELSKTVAQNGKDITSVTARTKTVEDDLAGTKTTLSQVQTTADSTSQKTATLETGLNGLNAKFETLKIGSRNYFKNSKSRKYYINDAGTQDVRTVIDDDFWQNDTRFTKDYVRMSFDIAFNPALPSNFTTNVHFSASPWYNCGGITFKGGTTALQHFDLKFDLSGAGSSYKTNNVFIRLNNTLPLNTAVSLENFNLYLSAVVEDYNQNEADIESKVAEYKQTADQNYASLSSTVQTLDGQVQSNKTTAEQTAAGFKTRIESLETYKDGESERANAYFESAKTETAKQLTAERTAIANNYVAKSTYTSDVTGIRNELSATTSTANATKTNLANYQASNDKVVASLKSSLQTTDGNVSNLQTKVEAVPGQITSAVSAVEGKIPTSSGGRNLAQGTSKDWSKPFTRFSGIEGTCPSLYRVITDGLVVGDTFKTRIVLKYTDIIPASGKTAKIWLQGAGNVTNWNSGTYPSGGASGSRSLSGSGEIVFELTGKINADHLKNKYWDLAFRTDWIASGSLQWKLAKAERGMFFTDWSPAPEDTISQIDAVSSELKQTKDGITLLATKTELNTAKNELQSGINTATSKADNAQSTANNNAQTISTHTTQISALNTGLQAKVSQTDFNTLSGRVTTAENNIIAKANELSSKITSVEGKIPTSVGGRNYIKDSEYRKASIIVNDNQSQDEGFNISPAFWQNSNVYNKKIKLSFYYQASVAYGTERKFPVYFRESPWPWIGEVTYPANTTRPIKYTIAMTNALPANFTAKQIFIRFTGNLDKGRDHIITKVMLEVSDIFSDWQPAPEDAAKQISSLSSEFKQTTDAIKASVSSLDNSTVKSSSLTINSDGIVMKAGKSTTDVANAIGSYFAVNQNAINLFSDKINVKGNMIVSGAITADKIAAGAIDASKIAANSISSDKIVSSGITADVINGGVLKAANDAMQINLNSSNITFSEDASVIFTSSDNALKRVIPGKPSQFIKMCDSVFVSEIGELPDSTITVIASNSDRTENIDSEGFGGVKIWNGSSSTDSTSFVELVGNRVAIYGNKNRSPWLFDMTTTTSSLIPQNSNGIKHSLGRGDRPFHEVYADNMYIQGERVAMMLKDIALFIGYKGNNGWVDRIS